MDRRGRQLSSVQSIRVVSIATLATVFGLVAPGLASATIHTGRIVFPEPHNPPSIGVPPPPAVQTKEFTREVIIRYNASAGTVTLRAEVFDPTLWGEQIGESFKLGSKCLSHEENLFHPLDSARTWARALKQIGQSILTPTGWRVGRCRASTASALPHAHRCCVARLGGLSQLDRLE